MFILRKGFPALAQHTTCVNICIKDQTYRKTISKRDIRKIGMKPAQLSKNNNNIHINILSPPHWSNPVRWGIIYKWDRTGDTLLLLLLVHVYTQPVQPEEGRCSHQLNYECGVIEMSDLNFVDLTYDYKFQVKLHKLSWLWVLQAFSSRIKGTTKMGGLKWIRHYQSNMSPTHCGYNHAKYQSQTNSSYYLLLITIMCIPII